MRIRINPDGTAVMIYTEDIDITNIGNVQSITRASYVEPANGNQWAADMRPVGGPVLGAFDKRSDALAAEVEWINDNILKYKKGFRIKWTTTKCTQGQFSTTRCQ